MASDRVVLRPDWWRAAEAVKAGLPADPLREATAYVELMTGLAADVLDAGPDPWGRLWWSWSRPARMHGRAHRLRAAGLPTAAPLGYARISGHGWLLRAPRSGRPLCRWGRPAPDQLDALADLLAATHRWSLWHPRPAHGVWWSEGPVLEELPRWQVRKVSARRWIEHVLADLDLSLRDGVRLARHALRHRWDGESYRDAVRSWRASVQVQTDVP